MFLSYHNMTPVRSQCLFFLRGEPALADMAGPCLAVAARHEDFWSFPLAMDEESGLCALAFSIHLTLLGEAGLTRLARVNHANAVKLADALVRVPDVSVLNGAFFNEFTIRVPGDAAFRKLLQIAICQSIPGPTATMPVRRSSRAAGRSSQCRF